jgi:hypothetical protein
MCLGSNIPDPPPPPPPPPQAAKLPDTAPLSRRNSGSSSMALPGASTLLTGPSGVASSQLNIGTSTLLGG